MKFLKLTSKSQGGVRLVNPAHVSEFWECDGAVAICMVDQEFDYIKESIAEIIEQLEKIEVQK